MGGKRNGRKEEGDEKGKRGGERSPWASAS